MKKEKLSYDDKYLALEQQLKTEQSQKNEERLLLAKHLSEKTKLYENAKLKLENVQGDFEATKNKHTTIVKELQREITKLRKAAEHQGDSTRSYTCSKCQQQSSQQSNGFHKPQEDKIAAVDQLEVKRSHSRQSSLSTTIPSSVGSASSRRGSESSESDTVTGRELDFKDENKVDI